MKHWVYRLGEGVRQKRVGRTVLRTFNARTANWGVEASAGVFYSPSLSSTRLARLHGGSGGFQPLLKYSVSAV